jgi:phenylacetate-CoA ligase
MIEFKFGDFFYPLDLVRTYWLLHRSEHWSAAQFEQYQADRLAQLLQHCAEQVPYYRDLFQQIGVDATHWSAERAFEGLQKLPLLDKDSLRAAPDRFVARNAQRFRPKRVSTSGTTGTPLTLHWDRGSNVMEFCSIQRLWRWAGIRLGQPFLDLRSRTLSDDARYLVRENGIRYIRNPKIGQVDFSSDLIDDSNIRRYYEVLLRFRPRLVRGHPQAIEHLAELLRMHGLDGWRPAAVTTASETLYDFQRRAIQEAWGVPILDSYGLIEHNVFIAQCRAGSYHVSPEYGVCEILDDEARPVGPGEEGWIVATGLHNYAQPLLRYNTRDRAVTGDGSRCRCGRTLPVVERIVGRIDDCVYASNGKRYSGFSFAFFDRPGLRMARLVQEDLRRVTVEVVADADFDGRVGSALVQDLERKVEGTIRFEIKHVDRIEQEEPGKFKFVVSRLGNRSPDPLPRRTGGSSV